MASGSTPRESFITSTPRNSYDQDYSQGMEFELSVINGNETTGHLIHSEEIFDTPESDESDTHSDGDGASESGDGTGESGEEEDFSCDPPNFSPLSPFINFSHNVEVYENDFEDDVPCEDTWDWIEDASMAKDTAFEFDESQQQWQTREFYSHHEELNCFMQFFTPEILDYIAEQSNAYFYRMREKCDTESRRMKAFKPITGEDILRIISVRICMGLDKKPKISHYWCNNPFYRSSIVPTIMTSDRYKEIHKYLHFCNNDEQENGDRLHKINEVWKMVTDNMSRIFSPGRNVCVDESLVLFKGKLFFKQYIPNKASKFGIKIFSLGDSASGYIINSIIYKGAGHQFMFPKEDYGFGGGIALELMTPYMDCGRCLFVDNYFTNPRMALQLLKRKTNVCGTLKKNLKRNPKMTEKIRRGDIRYHSCNGILVERWKDKKEVRLISTGMKPEMKRTINKSGAEKEKPGTVLLYNKNARAIDKCDMVVGMNDILRKTTKWYKKLFFHLVDVAIYNSSIMHAVNHTKVPMIEYKERLVRQIIDTLGEHKTTKGRKAGISLDSSNRLTERHFPTQVPVTGKSKFPTKECVVCRLKNGKGKQGRSQSRYMCPECNVGLCVDGCFRTYHTVKSI